VEKLARTVKRGNPDKVKCDQEFDFENLNVTTNSLISNPTVVDTAIDRVLAGSSASKQPPERASCFHCGENCKTLHFAQQDKLFCCRGCLIVHELLHESGLGHFYDLSLNPGVRIRGETRRSQFAYLDEPSVQERLLDFTDGKTSRVTFHIPAIHCVACVWLLENLFKLHKGIGRSQVNFSRREVSIAFATGEIRLSELVTLLVSIGYEPELTLGETEKVSPPQVRKKAWLQIGLAAFAFGNIMLMSLPYYLGWIRSTDRGSERWPAG
jgi:Cu+-exporting ATPase